MELLERESSLALLAEYAAEARLGHGRLVLVAGEAGSVSRRWWSSLRGTCRMPADAALIGARAEVRLVESVTGCPASAVDELLASGLLAGTASG